MSKSIYQLEKDRKDKIRDLNLDEVKRYIENLNKKVFEAFETNNHEKIDFYNERLGEVFDVTKGKYVNLELYSVGQKLDITTSRLIESNTKRQDVYVSLSTVVLINAEISLREMESILHYLLMIYYHNYSLSEVSLVEELLSKLEFEYDFKNEDFCEYAKGLTNQYNKTLIREFNYVIGMIKEAIHRMIELADVHISDNYEKEVLRILKEIEAEKDYVRNNENCLKAIKEGEYLDLLEGLKRSYEMSLDSYKSYLSIKDRILEMINSEDGFADLKEQHYEISNREIEGGLFTMDKEDYIAMRPSYDMVNCEFVESTYYKDLGVNDE